MVIDKVLEIIPFKPSNWLAKYIKIITQKRNQAVNDFEKHFYKLLTNAFYGKILENIRDICTIDFIKKDEIDKIIKQQSMLLLNGIHKSYENCDSYTFKQNEVLVDNSIYLGFAILELSKLRMCETYYDKLQPCFGPNKLQLYYLDCDSFVLSMKTEHRINDLKYLEDLIDFSNLDENHELFSNKNKKVIGKFKIETPKNIWIDEFVALRSKWHAFNFGDDSKIKLKGIAESQTKKIKFKENKICLDGEENVYEFDNFILRSINHDMYLQKKRKSTFCIFDDKRNYLDNIILKVCLGISFYGEHDFICVFICKYVRKNMFL